MKKALVTGGGGFLGRAVVDMLLERGVRVRSFSRNFYPALGALDVEQYQGNLANSAEVSRAAQGCDIVFHVAAKAGVWGSYRGYYRANVLGTQHVINACREHRISKLVYTSTPAVVFDGTDMEGIDESAPYPSRYLAHYPRTKAEAERAVLAANGDELATVSLRPHVIWGPGDHHWLPRILERGRAGQLAKIGDDKLIDTVYIDNAAEAHLLAADCLDIGSAAAGKAYFITNGEPIAAFDMVNRILKAGGVPPVTKRVPAPLAYGVGAIMEAAYGLFRVHDEPRLTRFVVKELSTAHWFDIGAARRDLRYEPRVSIDEGLARLTRWLGEEQREAA